MSKYAAMVCLPLLMMSWGCSSEPEPAPPITEDVQAEIRQHDAMVDELESKQSQ